MAAGPAHDEEGLALDAADLALHQVDHRRADVLHSATMPVLNRELSQHIKVLMVTMPETKLRFLGVQIRAARKRNNLTQQKLADQTGLAIKAVQETEKGKKNATYDTLSKLIQCLGISADTLFPTKSPIDNEKLQNLIRNVQMCDEKNQEVLLNTIGFLADQLLSEQEKAGSYQAQFEK